MIPDIYWISDLAPLRLAIMPRPRGGDWLQDEVAAWASLGIHTVVSLLQPFEAAELDIADCATLCQQRGIVHRSFPVIDRGVPDAVEAFLALITELTDTVKRGKAVAVHCRAGIGRSGLTTAAVLLRLGIPWPDVFPTISRARGLAVPDTPMQTQWLQQIHLRIVT